MRQMTNVSFNQISETSSSQEEHSSYKTKVDDTLSKIYTKKFSSSSIETYAPEMDRKILYNLSFAVFQDSKRHSKLRLLQDCVLGFLEWTQKLASRKSEVQALLHLLEKSLERGVVVADLVLKSEGSHQLPRNQNLCG